MTATEIAIQPNDFIRVTIGIFTGMTGVVADRTEEMLTVLLTANGLTLAFWPHELRRETKGDET